MLVAALAGLVGVLPLSVSWSCRVGDRFGPVLVESLGLEGLVELALGWWALIDEEIQIVLCFVEDHIVMTSVRRYSDCFWTW